jgi:hypothetical protein
MGKKWALLIGIDEYKAGKYEPLDNTKKDVSNMHEALLRYGYTEFIILKDGEATKERIAEALKKLQIETQLEDDVIIFFAGHSEISLASGKPDILPVDYIDRVDNVLMGDEIASYIDGMRANNVALILDSCFSGGIHSRLNAESSTHYYPVDGAASRWCLSAAGDNQTVRDGNKKEGSPFTHAVTSYMNSNTNGILPLEELYYFAENQLKLKGYTQTPQIRPLAVKSHRDGMFTFQLTGVVGTSLITKVINTQKQTLEEDYLARTVTEYSSSEKDFSILFRPSQALNLFDVINQHMVVVLLGNAGAGKTYELTHVQNLLWEEKRYVSINVTLDTYSGQQIDEFLNPVWKYRNPEHTILFLDGLDEAPTELFNSALRQIKDFMRRYPAMKIVISSRNNFYQLPTERISGTFEDIKIYFLDDITEEVMQEYVDRKMGNDNGNFTKELHYNMFEDVAGKAYFLKLLFRHYKIHKNLRVSRADLLKNAVENGIQENVQKYQMTTSVSLIPEIMVELLERIAYIMACTGKRILDEKEVFAIIRDPNERKMLPYLPFLYFNSIDRTWKFDHNNIQEYLSAKVLSRLTTEMVLERVVVKEVNMVSQYWMNILSFLFTVIGEPEKKNLQDWLLDNDPESMVRFERERIDIDFRATVGQKVFEQYASTDLWLASSRYKEKELVYFSESPVFLKFLLNVLQDKSVSEIVITNALRLIKLMQPEALTEIKEQLKIALYEILNRKKLDDYLIDFILSMIGRIYGNEDEILINDCIQIFKDRKNQHVRAGIYRLIYLSGTSDIFLDVIKDGINPDRISGGDQQTTVNLIDEWSNLYRALKGLKKPQSIKDILSFLGAEVRNLNSSGEEWINITTSIMEAAIDLYPKDNQLASDIFEFIEKCYLSVNEKNGVQYRKFFTRTGTIVWVVKSLLLRMEPKDNFTLSFTSLLISPEAVSILYGAYEKSELTNLEIADIYVMLKRSSIWNSKSEGRLLFEETFGKIKEIGLNIEEEIDFSTNRDEYLIKKLSSIFDLNTFKREIIEIYNQFGSGRILMSDFWDFRIKLSTESEIPFYAIFRHFADQVYAPSLDKLLEWVDHSKDFVKILLDELSQLLQQDQKKVLNLSTDQIAKVNSWLKDLSDSTLLTEISMESISLLQRVLFLMETLPIEVPESMLLAMTYSSEYNHFASENVVMDILEDKLSREKLIEKVISNVNNVDLPHRLWLPNAIYCIKNNLTSTFTVIKDRLNQMEDYMNFGYEFLEYFYERTQDLNLMIDFIQNAQNISLKLCATQIYSEQTSDLNLVISYLYQLLQTPNARIQSWEKMSIAEELLRLGNVLGLAYLTDKIINHGADELGLAGKLSKLTHTDCLPYLFTLFSYAKTADRSDSRMQHLAGKVAEGFINIAIQSNKNYQLVKAEIEKYLAENAGRIEDMGILKVSIIRMKEEKTKEFRKISLDVIEKDLRTFTFNS